MYADDLFAGAGGWDLAAATLGIHARGVENMPEARATRAVFGLETIWDDVWTYQPDGEAVGLIASPPCQSYSKAGKGSGRRALDWVVQGIEFADDLEALRTLAETVGDERTALVLLPLHFALTEPSYEWLAWEQVPGVRPVWEACAERLRADGWHTWTGVLHSEQYGDPQTRTRAFLLGSRHHDVRPPAATHSRFHTRDPQRLDAGVQPWVTLAQALGDMPGMHLIATNDRPNVARRRPDQPAPTMAFGHEEPRWLRNLDDGSPRWADQSGTAVDREWPARRPSTTVAGRELVQNPGATANRHNGATKSRNDGLRLTVTEAGVLQSFPHHFPWQGAKTWRYKQVGNAIPRRMAAAALREVI